MGNFTPHCAILLSKSYSIRQTISEMLESEGIGTLVSDSFEDIPHFVIAERDPEYLLIDIDEYGGVSVLYDRLRGLRDTLPRTAIIILSSEFKTDDFGTHRMMLADISIRLPMTYENMNLALIQGPLNNQIYNARQVEVGHPQQRVS